MIDIRLFQIPLPIRRSVCRCSLSLARTHAERVHTICAHHLDVLLSVDRHRNVGFGKIPLPVGDPILKTINTDKTKVRPIAHRTV